MKRPAFTTFLIYLVLVTGAVIFAFPFVWLMASSVKVDRELFTRELRVLPQEPLPRAKSPYYETRRLDPVEGEAARNATLVAALEAVIRQRVPALPDEAIQPVAIEAVAGLPTRAPAATLAGPLPALIEFATADLSVVRINELAVSLKRELLLGTILVRGTDTQDHELFSTTPPSQRWTLTAAGPNPTAHTPAPPATLTDDAEGIIRYARVSYDLQNIDNVTFTARTDLPFSGADFHRIQLRLRPDDTWHNVELSVDVGGRHYTAQRPAVLSDFEWTTLSLQLPSPDDSSTRIKTWVVLQDAGPSDVTGNRIALTLNLSKATKLQAAYNKLSLNYQRVLDHIPFWRYVRVSLFLVIANIMLSLLFSSLAAYAFARITWPGREFCFVLMLATMMIPGQVTMVPHFLIWKSLGAYNTLTPLWLGAAFGNAFFIFLLRQFMRGIPRDLEDAARIDGCGFLRIYWHVIVPLIKPSLAAIAIFTFIGTWNDFMGPLIYVADQRLYPLAFGLYAFSVQVSNNPTLTMAASVLITLPIIVLFFSAQKYFIQGVTMTGMKG